MKIKKCIICGEAFKTYPSTSKAKFCSAYCFNIWQMDRPKKNCKIHKNCLVCGKEFYVCKSWSKKKYCSKKCSGVAHRTKTKVICLVCKKEFYVEVNELLSGKKYCSWGCYTKSKVGKKLTMEHKNKISCGLKERYANGYLSPLKGRYGKEASRWDGGLSFEIYPQEFDNDLKEQIRQRDNYTCQLCGIIQKKLNRKLDVHHIDYIKKNCSRNNLISLCSPCNFKVNTNKNYWIGYFKGIILTV